MLIKELNHYVKFVFNIQDSEENFVTSDVEALKGFTETDSLKIGQIIETGGIKVKVLDISIKQINDTVRSNKFGVNLKGNEGEMIGQLKDSLITINILVEQLD